eukprot:1973830-Prymnesium_polylepis.1
MDPLITNELVYSELTDGYAAAITMLVALTAMPAVGVRSQCRHMLRYPDSPDQWQAPGVPDTAAGEWPAEVASKLVVLVVGMSSSEFKEERMPLSEALSELEAIAYAAPPEVSPPPPSADASAGSGGAASALPDEGRSCTICLDRSREVRFACGHCVA